MLFSRRAFLAAPVMMTAARAAQPLYPSLEEMGARLEEWGRSHSRIFQLHKAGESVEKRPIWMARVTDAGVPEEVKERILISALHTGLERVSAPAVMGILKWLLSEDPAARETLRRQVVYVMPAVNPDGYVRGTHTNANGFDPYTGWTVDGPRDPEKMPEAVAFQRVLDEAQPEVHADVHGHSMDIPGYYHVESSGRAYSNTTLRPFRSAVVRLMDEAAEAEGFGSDYLEDDAERVFGGTAEMGIPADKFWLGVRTGTGGNTRGVTSVYAALYGYNRYHTMMLASECAWDRSALLRHRRLLEIGNSIWPGERYAGYPTRIVVKNGFHQLAAWGADAASRRRSRVELWNAQGRFTTAVNNPQVEGKTMFICATTASAARWFEPKTLEAFARKIGENAAVDAGPVRQFLEGFPRVPGQWGPEAMLLTGGNGAATGSDERVRHGLAMRLRIPYPKARGLDVRLNGRPVAEHEKDGFLAWPGRGFLTVQINVPPERSRREDFFLVTVRFDPGEKRTQGIDWR
jgi:hypothetical protein